MSQNNAKGLPNQKIPFSQKNKSWQQDTIDYYIGKVGSLEEALEIVKDLNLQILLISCCSSRTSVCFSLIKYSLLMF